MLNTFIDVCSGIGGGRLGMEQAGLTCVAYSDTSRLSVKTYQLMFKTNQEKKYGNLKFIRKDNCPEYDVLVAGFPCQTFSVIGRKEGFSDDRGQIIFHLARILNETQPKCFILENVKGLVTHDKGKTIQVILKELDSAGYSVTYKVLSSLDYGVPQMRQRVYFIGVRKDISKSLDDFCWPEAVDIPKLDDYLVDRIPISEEHLENLQYYLKNPTNNGKYTINDLLTMEGKVFDTRMNDLRIYEGKVPTLRSQRDGILYVKNGIICALTGYEALLLQGFPKEYADKVKYEVTDRHLLMQAGNAMTVNVMRLLGVALKEYIENRRIIKMAAWEDFEVECTKHLQNNYHEFANFVHKGKSDSTIPDIEVTTKSGRTFFIDVKHCPAQCGQFVLLPNIACGCFEYSKLNSTSINKYSRAIMNFMNSDFDSFKEAGTSGKNIDMQNGSEVFAKWIITTYKNKEAKFFITNDYVMIPIDRFADYFYVSATYRIKRSGSGSVGKRNIPSVIKHIDDCDYGIISKTIDKEKLYVTSNRNIHNVRFVLGGTEFMFSERGERYEIRKLSNTFNANVIFSIDLKPNVCGMSKQEIEDSLR